MTALYWIAASFGTLAVLHGPACARLWIDRAHQRQRSLKSQLSALNHGRNTHD